MSDHLARSLAPGAAPRADRRAFLGLLAAAGVAAPVALLAPSRVEAQTAGDCSPDGRDTRPHKGFASTREGSGGQCTTHAARRFDTVAPDPGVNWRGNAVTWYDHASAAGWVVSADIRAARPGAIAVWDTNAGHVAYVEAVSESGITVSEMNWGGYGCAGWSRYRTSMWGRESWATLTWAEVRSRLGHGFIGYIYPQRRDAEIEHRAAGD